MESHGTSVVIVWTPKEIIVGADSKLIREQAGRQIEPERKCKIWPCGEKYWVVMAGVYGKTEVGYDAKDLAIRAGSSAGTVEQLAVNLQNLITQPLYSAVSAMRAQGSRELARLEQAGTFLQFAVIGVDEGVSRVSARQFRPGLQVDILEYPGIASYVPGSAARLLMGDNQVFTQYETTDRDWYFRYDCAQTIHSQLTRQATMFPDNTGLPIQVLSVSVNGAKWLYK